MSFYGTGTLEAVSGIFLVPKKLLRSHLPIELSFAPVDDCDPAMHPVQLLLGQHRQLAGSIHSALPTRSR